MADKFDPTTREVIQNALDHCVYQKQTNLQNLLFLASATAMDLKVVGKNKGIGKVGLEYFVNTHVAMKLYILRAEEIARGLQNQVTASPEFAWCENYIAQKEYDK